MRYALALALSFFASPALAWTDGGGPMNLKIPALTDSGSSWSESLRYDLAKLSTGTVTLGTANSGNLTVGGLTATYGVSAATGAFGGITVTYGVSAATAVITYVQASSITTTGNQFIQGSLAVGAVGLSAPATKLHMSSGTLTVDGTGAAMNLGSGTGSSRMIVKQSDTTLGIAVQAVNNDDYVRIRHSDTVGIIDTTYSATGGFTPLAFGTSDAERMRIDTGGNVGIGTTLPGTKLHMSSGTLTVDGTNVTTVKLSGTAGACMMYEDTDEAGWTECDFLNGVMTCSIDADGICD